MMIVVGSVSEYHSDNQQNPHMPQSQIYPTRNESRGDRQADNLNGKTFSAGVSFRVQLRGESIFATKLGDSRCLLKELFRSR